MGLLVWLPLNGDLHNQGLRGDVTVAVTGTTTWNNAGKIGKCLSCNGSTFWNLNPVTIGTNASFCWWAKTTDSNCMFFIVTASVNSNLNVWAYNGYLYLNTRDSTSNPFKSDNGSMITSKVDNAWHHYAVTFDGSRCSLYIDGRYVGKAQTYKSPASNNTKIVRIAGGFNGTHAYDLTGSLNDFRIYDHCLSPKEVHEISKGLLLHYKLDQDPLFGKNLLPVSAQRNNETGFRPSREYVNLFDYKSIVDTYGLITYTVSFDAKSAIDHSFNLYWDYSSGSKYSFPRTSINLTTEWQRFTYTFTPAINNASGTWAGMSIYGYYGSGAIPTFRRVKLELGSIATPMDYDPTVVEDVSGYGNDGVINGDLLLSADTPRYNNCTSINDGTSYITRESLNGEINTISVWFKTTKNKSTPQLIFADSNSRMAAIIYGGGLITYCYSGKGGTGSRVLFGNEYIENEWNHIAVILTGLTTRDVYCNGIKLETTSNDYYLISDGNLYIGKRAITTLSAIPFYGTISDLRIYSTVLSADDIKELYDTGAWIDNKYNVEAYEFVEDSDETITKTGIVKSDRFDEVEFYDYLQGDGHTYINTLIPYDSTKSSYKIECKFSQPATVGTYDAVFGAYTNEASKCLRIIRLGNNNQLALYYNNQAGGGNRVVLKTANSNIREVIITSASTVVTENGVTSTYTNMTPNGTNTTSTFYLFCQAPNSILSKSRIYYFKFYDNNTLIKYFIPCVYNGTPGMWDRVERKFYGNDGTGTFTLGDRVDSVSIYSDNLEANQLIEI